MSTIGWLLEPQNPSVRYYTLRDVLGRRYDDPDVLNAKKGIPDSPEVTKIMAKQDPRGHWGDAESPYLPKYKSSYWQIMVLGELGVDRADERVERACEKIFRFQREEGGFSCYGLAHARREYSILTRKTKCLPPRDEWTYALLREHQLSCLTGNISAALTRLGYGDDARVHKALRWLTEIQNEDGGWLCPYWRAHAKDKHSCFGGTIGPLDAFSALPRRSLTGEMKRAAEKGANFLLMHRLFRADHHNYRIINRSWLRLGFPLFYGYGILRALDILTRLGYSKDERLTDAAHILIDKRRRDGTWILESTPTGRMQVNVGIKGRSSKWITLIALRSLKRIYGPAMGARSCSPKKVKAYMFSTSAR